MSTSTRMRNWKKKVLTIHEGFNLQHAKIKKEVMPILHSALWGGNMIRASYKSAVSKTIKKYQGMCFETQGCPNAPNNSKFPSTRLDPSQTYKHNIKFEIEEIK